MRFIIYILLTGLACSSQAQIEIRGKIMDALTQEPLAGASVKDHQSSSSTVSGAKGEFLWQGASFPDSLTIVYPGYETGSVAVEGRTSLVIALQPEILNLQEVVITANREQQDRSEAPVAIHKISPKMLEETRPSLLHEVLNKVPGVVMVNLNNEQHAMSIRQPLGYNAYFLYLEDGIPVRPTGVYNHNGLIEINQIAVNSIEVIKGPSSSLYGSEAIGGAINFITQKPAAVPTARVGAQFDNYGYSRLQFSAGLFPEKNLGIYVGGYMARQREGWQTFSDYDKLSLNLRADYYLGEHTKVTGALSVNDYDSQMGGSVDSSSFYERKYRSLTDFAYRKVKALRGRVTVSRYWSNKAESFVTVFTRRNSIGQFPAYAIRRVQNNTALAHGQINENSFHSFGAIAQNSMKPGFLKSRIITGISIDYSPNTYWAHYVKVQRDPSSGLYTGYTPRPDSMLVDYHAGLLNSAIYAQYEFSPFKSFKAVAGMRYDRIDFNFDNHLSPSAFSGAPDEKNSFNNLTPKIGLTYDFGKGRGMYANYSRGFSPPTISQLYTGVKVPELKPAFFDNYEAGGWTYLFNKKIYLDMSIYQMTGYREIINYLLPDNSTEYRNAGRTMHRGIEYNLTWSPAEELFFRLGGTNSVHKFIEYSTKEGQSFDGKEMPNAPHWIANSEITYKPRFFRNFRIGMEWQRISSYYKDNANKYKYEDRGAGGLRGVSIFNFRTAYSFKGIEVFMNILNITNELYANMVTRGNFGDTFTPASPRVFTFGILFTVSAKE